jgi:5'-3' exonuclease
MAQINNMGIKNLTQFLRKYKVYETLDINLLKYTKVAIDTPMFLYKFKGVTEPTTNDWLGCFVTFVAFLRKYDIHPIFLFEGKSPPEKAPAQEKRRQQRQKMSDRTDTIEKDLETYIGTGNISELLFEVWEKLKHKNKSLLVKRTLTKAKTFVDVETVKEEIYRRKRYEITITTEDINALKELFDLMGVSWIQSSGEAETDCVSLFYDGVVDYIVSEDTDVLAYFNPSHDFQPLDEPKDLKVITNIDTTNLTFEQVSKEMVLDSLNLTSESFRDFCIMCGTDYNDNIPRVGVETSYKLILKWDNIEGVPLDIDILNHHRGRKLFEVKSNHKLHEHIKWCLLPQTDFIDELTVFMFTYNFKNVDTNYVFKALTQPSFDLEVTE